MYKYILKMFQNSRKARVLLGMSGGVDSSTAAFILKQQGYEVVGITITSIKITDDCKIENNKAGCCNYQSIIDAVEVADHLGIEHHIVDLSEIFKEKIIDNFVQEYLRGRTPNPCTICNPLIKWGEILKKADDYDCQLYATGHYARIYFENSSSRYYIKQAKDKTKDQSYFLWGLSQEQISRTVFPLGDLTKQEVRKIAKDANLIVYNKHESQEICFVPSNNYRDVIVKQVGDPSIFKPGNIIFRGVVVGRHKGYPFYTVGQRKGLGISYHEPLFVKEIQPETNTIIIDVENGLLKNKLWASNVNLMKYDVLPSENTFLAKIRYKDAGASAKVYVRDGNLEVFFLEPRRAITPGQSVVIYEGEDLIAGGIINRAE
ncbi:MAG: tRNA 2-thiouridine(34) synthase MnmA [Candidatus Kapaibacteriales bacterium]